ncbi:MAG: NAD(P)/FAD-dependent oxidoreductase [Clostridia bacterium]
MRVVVVGGGFGGLAVAKWLRHFLGPGSLSITVVDWLPDMVFRPDLVHALDWHSLTIARRTRLPRSSLLRRLRVQDRRDAVVHIDAAARIVHLAATEPLPYDVLFLAPGHESAWDAIPGLDASIGGVCEPYLARHTAVWRRAWTGGSVLFFAGPILGASGWNPAPMVSDEYPMLEALLLFEGSLRQAGQRDVSRLTVMTPAHDVAESAGAAARERLRELFHQRGIAVITDAHPLRIEHGTVVLRSGRDVVFDQAVIVPPYRGCAWLQTSGLADAYGWVPVTAYGQHPAYPEVYAVGDIVGRPWPRLGHAAMVQARVAVTHFVSVLEKRRAPAPYRPALAWICEIGQAQGLFVLNDQYWGGSRNILLQGCLPTVVKRVFSSVYRYRAGNLPVMP